MLTARLLSESSPERQIARERDAVRDGVKRYWDDVQRATERGQAHELSAMRRLFLHWHPVVAARIREEARSFVEGGTCVAVSPGAMGIIALVDADEAAYLTIAQSVQQLVTEPEGTTVRVVAMEIGRAVVALVNARTYAEEDAAGWQQVRNEIKRLTPQYVQRRLKKEFDRATFSTALSLGVGTKLLNILVSVASVRDYDGEEFEAAFGLYQTYRYNSNHKMIRLTQPAMELIEEAHIAREAMRPVKRPMVCKPVSWENHEGGGYYIIKSDFLLRPKSGMTRLLKDKPCPVMDTVVNIVSAVPHTINQPVLRVAQEMYASGDAVGKVPAQPPRRPSLPPGFNPDAGRGQRWVGVSDADRRAWKKAAAEAYAERIKLSGKRFMYEQALGMAEELKDESAIFFPYRPDFRGRIYPDVAALNFHESDPIRGLLQFKDRVSFGRDGERWFKIHAANCYGVDKVSFDARVAWFDSQVSEMQKVASDPKANRFWTEASEPWQFLACCFATCDDRAAQRIIAKIDGTCNGLQHYSAMLRDPVGGALVNLVPSDQPAHAYMKVLEVVRERMQDDSRVYEISVKGVKKAVDGAAAARAVMAGLDTKAQCKIVKTPVMTEYYGVTRIGAYQQVQDTMESLGLETRTHEAKAARSYLADAALDSTRTVVPGANAGKNYIAEYAHRIAKSHHLVQWDAPSGWTVRCWYGSNYRAQPVDTPFGSMKLYDWSQPPQKVDTNKFKNATPANFVHSVDQSHMAGLVMTADGVVIPVHDCFASHCGSMASVHETVLAQFVELHRRPLLECLAEQWAERYPSVEAPEMPALGTLDIEQVARAVYAFA